MPWPHLHKTDDQSINALWRATLAQTTVVKEMMDTLSQLSGKLHPPQQTAAMNVSDTALRRYSETKHLMTNESMEDSA